MSRMCFYDMKYVIFENDTNKFAVSFFYAYIYRKQIT